jgi:hypothetical protein
MLRPSRFGLTRPEVLTRPELELDSGIFRGVRDPSTLRTRLVYIRSIIER